MKKVVSMICVLAVCAGFTLSAGAADEKVPSIKQVMGACFKKGKLADKVSSGKASDAEKKTFHKMMEALAKNTPKKGDAESWKMKTAALVKAAKAIVDGDASGVQMLGKAKNCKKCHSVHK